MLSLDPIALTAAVNAAATAVQQAAGAPGGIAYVARGGVTVAAAAGVGDLATGAPAQAAQSAGASADLNADAGLFVAYAIAAGGQRLPRLEAMLLADHLVVLEAGQVVQQGTPQQVYEEPATAAVAALLGENNRLPGTVMALDAEDCQVRLDCGPELWARHGDAAGPGSRCIVAVRPERVAVAAMRAEEMGEGALEAVLRDVIFLGAHLRLVLEVGRGGMLVAKRPPGSRVPRLGGPAAVAWDPYAAFAFRALR
jgi:hypothetical protein